MALSELLTPRIVQIKELGLNTSRVTLEPLERGFGYTLGTALRRVLLSSLEGAAITQCEIDGVLHEYSAIEGVREDVIDVLLNLKGVALVMHEGERAEMHLSVNKAGDVKASAFNAPSNIEIVNPDHVIAHLTSDVSFKMRVVVEKGRGYQVVSDETESETASTNMLRLDASFSPIRRIAYRVEQARVEQRTDLDKLIIDIESNGTVNPEQAIRDAATILHHQISVFVDLESTDLEDGGVRYGRKLKMVIVAARERGVACYAMAMTPTEVRNALHLPVDGVQLYPADVVGAPMAQRLRAIGLIQHVLPRGGLAAYAAKQWLKAGAPAVCLDATLLGDALTDTESSQMLWPPVPKKDLIPAIQ